MLSIFKNYKFYLILFTLLIAFSLRVYTHSITPLQKTSIYAHYYEPALFYLSGKGMNVAKGGNPELRKKIDDFLYLRTDSLDKKDLYLYIENPKVYYQKRDKAIATFSYYIAASVWKVFGISWSTLFYFYAFISTLGGLILFFIARKITDSYWAGLFTAVVYALAVPEIYGAAWSIRNTSPVWFFIFALGYLFLFTGVYKHKYLNNLSYFLLGIVTLVGIGWRSDPLLFFPFIAIVFFVLLLIKKKKELVTSKDIAIAIVLFLLGSFAVLSFNSSLKPKTQSSLNFMHIAKFGGYTRALKLSYENNFQNQFSDAVTFRHVKYYSEYSYPEEENPYPYTGKYGRYCTELYLKALEHNIYRWVESYPRYFHHTFIKKDLASSNSGSKPPETIKSIWKNAVYIAILGGVLLFYLGVWRFEVSALLGFTFYYSLVYYSMLPMIKHMMIMVVPISLLAGMTIYFFCRVLLDNKYRKEMLQEAISIKNIKIFSIILGIGYLVYYLLLYSTMLYSTNIKETYIKEIKNIALNGKDIEQYISKNRRELSIDLTGSVPVGLIINFHTLGTEGLVSVKHSYKRGQFRPFKYAYRFNSDSTKQTLFTTCYTIGKEDKYSVNVRLPYNAVISEARLVSLDKWNGVYYGAVYSDKDVSAGAESLRGINHKESILSSSREQLLETTINIKELMRKSKKFDYIDGKNWKIKVKKAYIWSQLHDISNVQNKYSYISAVVKKKDIKLYSNLQVKIAYFDKNDSLLYKSPEYFVKNIAIHYEKDKYEIIFNSSLPVETKKIRLIFTAKKGKYKIPKNIDIYQWYIKNKEDGK